MYALRTTDEETEPEVDNPDQGIGQLGGRDSFLVAALRPPIEGKFGRPATPRVDATDVPQLVVGLAIAILAGVFASTRHGLPISESLRIGTYTGGIVLAHEILCCALAAKNRRGSVAFTIAATLLVYEALLVLVRSTQ